MNIRAQLLRRIGQQWKQGDRLPSIRELASDLGSGYVNTHRAIRALADEGVLVARDRVGVFVAEDADVNAAHRAEAISMQPGSSVLRPLAGMRVKNIMVADCHPFHERQAEALAERMRANLCEVENVYIDIKQEGWRDLTAMDCEAIALIGHLDSRGYRVPPNTAVVMSYQGLLGDTAIEQVTDFDGVTVDQVHGGLLAGRFLKESGVGSACFIGRQFKLAPGPGERPNRYDELSKQRLHGFESGFGQPVPEEYRLKVRWYGPSPAARLVPQFLQLDPRPEAVFAATDEIAIGFIHGAQSHGLEPGRDYQIIGFDGMLVGRELYEGPLTTIDIPVEEMGRRAADLLGERMLQPNLPRRQMQLGCTLFRGNTVHPLERV